MHFRYHTYPPVGNLKASYNLISKGFAEFPKSIFVVHSGALSKRHLVNFIRDTNYFSLNI